jgi:phosphoribosylanthranilate isomerase
MSIKVKICGLTNRLDAQTAVDAGADFLGFIFHPKSPRYVEPDQVEQILSRLELPPHVQTVGVFVNKDISEVLTVLEQTGLSLAQLHGDEPQSALESLKGRGYKAVRPADAEAAQQAAAFTAFPPPHAPQLLLDAYHPSAYGGTGHKADWRLAAAVAEQTPRLLLAGGLTADNVQSAIAAVRPWGVDVASGVEAAPGRKDHEQLRLFITNARQP